MPQIHGGYSEGVFAYSGEEFTAATISFFSGLDISGLPVTDFGLDNLAFVTPEPVPFFGMACGLLAIGMTKRRSSGR